MSELLIPELTGEDQQVITFIWSVANQVNEYTGWIHLANRFQGAAMFAADDNRGEAFFFLEMIAVERALQAKEAA